MNKDFLNELNDSQREAVMNTEGPLIVIAGAGAGKTKMLTCRIAYMLSCGKRPFNILALTFTNKAAREMKNRISMQVGEELAHRLWMGTFHSIFSRILRTEATSIGFTSRFTIYDASDSRGLVKAIIKEKGLDDKAYKTANVASRISAAKNRLILPDEYISDVNLRKADMAMNIGMTGVIYKEYMERCRRSDALDFDDLLLYTYLLLRDNAMVRNKYVNQFEYILVDEYQDTNYAQHAIVKLLVGEKKNICVVGDDAQSIYAFRGADIGNILMFQSQFAGTKLCKLERNYRSTQNIVGAANSIIKQNKHQIRKDVYSCNEVGEPVTIKETYSDIDEAELVVRYFRNLFHSEHVPYNEMVVLYRTNSQSRVIEESLRKHSIPYRIYGGLSFYQRKEIKDILSYFRLCTNPNDEEAIKRVINYPTRGIGATSIDKLLSAALQKGVSLWEVIRDPIKYDAGINASVIKKVKIFVDMIYSFTAFAANEDAAIVAQHIIKHSGIWAEVTEDRSPENLSRQENIQELLNAIEAYETEEYEEGGRRVRLDEYMSEVSLLTDADTHDDDEPKISLMTIHASKGLEFDAVCVVGIEENIFPNERAAQNPREMEEERRLFYVAVTRAKRFCLLSYARNRYRYGQPIICSRSRFLDEISNEYTKEDNALHKARDSRYTASHSSFLHEKKMRSIRSIGISSTYEAESLTGDAGVDTSASGLVVGDVIEHERFGVGEVKSIVPSGGTFKATVSFVNFGNKTLLLSFARFKKR